MKSPASIERIWTDGYDIPHEGIAPSGYVHDELGGLHMQYMTNERFPMITREAMRADVAAGNGWGYFFAKLPECRKKLYASDSGWFEIPYENDLLIAEGT